MSCRAGGWRASTRSRRRSTKELLTLEELTAWMQAVNSLRLILGTMLEINEDGQEPVFDPNDPNARTVALYGYLGGLLDEIVEAQLNP